MSNSSDNQETAHAEEHELLIKTPKQLIVVVALSFILPVVGIILLANWVARDDRPAAGSDALGAEATALRIAPIAKLELVDVSAPAEVRSGDQVYAMACAACHDAGVAGAHKYGDQVAWATPIGTGLDAMTNNVINGKGAMPARGGNPNLTDAEIQNAVIYMANAAGGDFSAPAAETVSASAEAASDAPADPAAQVATAQMAEAKEASSDAGAPKLPEATTNTPTQLAAAQAEPTGADLALGEKIYNQACVACHVAGVAGAPKLGDKAAWAPRIATGMDAMIASVINGKGVMPARGGAANASDKDLAAAVHYMVSKSE
jgi:cytochrome c5